MAAPDWVAEPVVGSAEQLAVAEQLVGAALAARPAPVAGPVDLVVEVAMFPPSRHPYSAAGGVGGGSVGSGGGAANSICSAGTAFAAAHPAMPAVQTWLSGVI